MSNDRRLTQEERDYLQTLFKETQPGASIPSTEIGLVTSSENLALFEHLLGSTEMQLRANYGHLGFVFPVELRRKENGEFSMELRMPQIYELQGTVRSWRAPIKGDAVRLIDPEGRLPTAQVIDISQSGISIVDERMKKLPEGTQLPGLFLDLPDTPAPVPMTGTVVRIYTAEHAGNPHLAIRFNQQDEAFQAAIRDYLFRKLRELQIRST
ncbi:MAG: PilZ domain-containing protein [Pseudomonadota bacterium]